MLRWQSSSKASIKASKSIRLLFRICVTQRRPIESSRIVSRACSRSLMLPPVQIGRQLCFQVRVIRSICDYVADTTSESHLRIRLLEADLAEMRAATVMMMHHRKQLQEQWEQLTSALQLSDDAPEQWYTVRPQRALGHVHNTPPQVKRQLERIETSYTLAQQAQQTSYTPVREGTATRHGSATIQTEHSYQLSWASLKRIQKHPPLSPHFRQFASKLLS